MSLNFVKVAFPDKVTGLWAFEVRMPYQKYQGPAIVVRCVCIYIKYLGTYFGKVATDELLCLQNTVIQISMFFSIKWIIGTHGNSVLNAINVWPFYVTAETGSV